MDSKLYIAVNRCLSLSVSPVMNWQLFQSGVYPASRPNASWVRLQPPTTLMRISNYRKWTGCVAYVCFSYSLFD